jgi:hypothetical protein
LFVGDLESSEVLWPRVLLFIKSERDRAHWKVMTVDVAILITDHHLESKEKVIMTPKH